MPRALLLTVGTGHLGELESSLLAPLRLSINKGQWDRVVLLPSTLTDENSREIARTVAHDGIEVRPLPAPDEENDADACFRHFDAEIENLRREGLSPEDILVDFTRGTKAMSAALVLAAVGHGLSHLRYITGERDGRGTVMPGSERIRETSPAAARGRRRMDLARGLVEEGAFAAALAVLPDPDRQGSMGQAFVEGSKLLAMRALAGFFAAWDRLNYRDAADLPRPQADMLPAAWQRLAPTPEQLSWVSVLAAPPDRDDKAGMAAWLRPLAVDLLANAERRIAQQQFEDALVRAYRVLELVGQARLFDHGIDSEAVPEDDPHVQSLRQRLGGSSDFGRNRHGGLTAPRELAARLLKEKGDPLGKHLLRVAGRQSALQPKARNLSVLIHGFEVQAPASNDDWGRLLNDLWGLLCADRGGMSEALKKERELVSFVASRAAAAAERGD